jgi:hypothetical protein
MDKLKSYYEHKLPNSFRQVKISALGRQIAKMFDHVITRLTFTFLKILKKVISWLLYSIKSYSSTKRFMKINKNIILNKNIEIISTIIF